MALVRRVCDYLEEQGKPVSLAQLGRIFRRSPFHLQRVFKRVVGLTPRQYAEALRIRRLKEELARGANVTRAQYAAGYGSSSRLYEQASARMGMTPATYRRRGKGMRIHYAIVDCPLGRLLVAATERGICRVDIGDSEEALETALREEFSAAELVRNDKELRVWVEAIVRHLEGEQPHLDLPLDVRGTAFQQRVWEELRKIPYGQTRSYAEIARAIGRPTAYRAVARACATNPVPIVIPCHRVVRSDGGLGGYGLGLDRKKALLEGERQRTSEDSPSEHES